MELWITNPSDLADVIKAGQLANGKFFQPFSDGSHVRVHLGWDGQNFVQLDSDGEKLVAFERLMPLTVASA